MPPKQILQQGYAAPRYSIAGGQSYSRVPPPAQAQQSMGPLGRQPPPHGFQSGRPSTGTQQVRSLQPQQPQQMSVVRQPSRTPPQQQQEAEAAASAEGDEGYYYYYQLPDGSWGYAPAGYSQQYSPVDEGGAVVQQPAGYDEPAYGGGTGYQVVQGEDGSYYYYENVEMGGSQAPAQTQQQQMQQVQGTVGVAGMNNMVSGANAPPYTLPVNHKEVRGWQGAEKWHGNLCCICWKHPCYCLGATLFPWACLCTQRQQMLDGQWENYVCCAGLCGPKMCKGCNHTCGMFWESVLCTPCAIHANRFMLMKRHNVRRAPCDSCVDSLSCVCFCCLCCDKGDWARTACDWLYCLAYPCLITQQQIMAKHVLHPGEIGMK